MPFVDPVKYIIKDLSIDENIKSVVNKTTDTSIESSSSPGDLSTPRVFLETLKMWDKTDDNCYGITIAKQRFGSGKSPLDQTVEFAMEFICWSNRGRSEHNLWDLWSIIDEKYHDNHDYKIGYDVSDVTDQTPLLIMHSNRFQEPSFELRFGSTSGSAVARLSSAQKLRLSSLSSIYNFVGWEKTYTIPSA